MSTMFDEIINDIVSDVLKYCSPLSENENDAKSSARSLVQLLHDHAIDYFEIHHSKEFEEQKIHQRTTHDIESIVRVIQFPVLMQKQMIAGGACGFFGVHFAMTIARAYLAESDSRAKDLIQYDLTNHASFWKSLHDQIKFLKSKHVYLGFPDEMLDPSGMQMMIEEFEPILQLGGAQTFECIPNLSLREMEIGAIFPFQMVELQDRFHHLSEKETFLKCFLIGTGAHWDCLVVNKLSSLEMEVIYTSTHNIKNLSLSAEEMFEFSTQLVNESMPIMRERMRRKKKYRDCSDQEIEEMLMEGRPHPYKVTSIEECIEWYCAVQRDTLHVFDTIVGSISGTRTIQQAYFRAFMEGLMRSFSLENMHRMYLKTLKQLKNHEQIENEHKTLSLARQASYVGLEVYVMKNAEFCHPVMVRDGLLDPLKELGCAHVEKEVADRFIQWIKRIQDEYSSSALSSSTKEDKNLIWLMNILLEIETLLRNVSVKVY